MKNKKYFLDRTRERLGKPPIISRHSPKQKAYFQRNLLIPFFRDQAKELHGTTYFEHPLDFKSAENANSAVGKLLKDFFTRCDSDLDKAKEIVTWYLTNEDYFRATENQYSPTVCFSLRTVTDFENKDIAPKKKGKEVREI